MEWQTLRRALAGLTLCLLAAGCLQGEPRVEAGPQEVLSRYLEALLQARFEESYSYLSSADRAAQSLADYLQEKSLEGSFMARQLAKPNAFHIRQVVVEGDRASIDADITAPDFERLYKDIFGEAFLGELTASNMDNVSLVRRKVGRREAEYKRDGIPSRTVVETFTLVREKDGWKVARDRAKNKDRT